MLRFRHCDSLADAELRLGSEIQLLLVDEATRQDPAAVQFLTHRLRTSNRAIPVLGVRMGSNPGGKGHGWCKRRYVDATAGGATVYEDIVDGKPTGHLIRFLPARYTDNPHLIDYESVLDAIPDPRLRVAYRDGSWTTFAGQVFLEWNADRHIIAPFAIPAEWARVAGIDYGYAAPWSVQWIAQDPDRRVYVYRELHDTQVLEAEQARRILAAEGNLVGGRIARTRNEKVTRYLDPSCWAQRHDVANSIANIYTLNGAVCARANNDRVAGWTRVHSFLGEGPACVLHRQMGWVTCPMLHVFNHCTNLIRTLPDLPADKDNPEDVDTDADDHDADALRYGLMPLPMPHPQRQVLPNEPVDLQTKVHADLQARKAGQRRAQRQSDSGILGRF